MVRVWTADLDAGRPNPALDGPIVAHRRHARATALAQVAQQAGTTVARRCPVCGGTDHGRPELSGNDDISVTSADRWALIARADCRVGIDLELFGGAIPSSTAILSVAEVAALAARPGADRAAALIRLWTAKEAVAKADGRGLTLPFDRLDAAEVLRNGRARIAVADDVWHVTVADRTFPDGRRGSVALATPRASPGSVWIAPPIDPASPGSGRADASDTSALPARTGGRQSGTGPAIVR